MSSTSILTRNVTGDITEYARASRSAHTLGYVARRWIWGGHGTAADIPQAMIDQKERENERAKASRSQNPEDYFAFVDAKQAAFKEARDDVADMTRNELASFIAMYRD